jgi:hypothetical protein
VRYCLTIGQSKFAYKDNIFYVALYDATHKIQNGTTGCNAAFVDFIMNATDANVVKSVITLLKSKGQYTSTYNDYGVGQTYNKMINTSTSKNYLLVNNRFNIPNYNY